MVRRAQAGERAALEALVLTHEPWIYNIALRMLWHPEEAEDTTQDILVKVLTKLATFEGRSSFRTWLYRIVVNHVLSANRGKLERASTTFEEYGQALERLPSEPLDRFPEPERLAIIEEGKLSCMTAILLCLDRKQRLVFILGGVFEIDDKTGGEILQIDRTAFRKRLSRARKDLYSFLDDKCGLINKTNPCRCSHKTKAFIDRGYVDPDNFKFHREHVARVRDVARREMDAVDEVVTRSYPMLFREHPFADPPSVIEGLRALLRGTAFADLFAPQH